MASGIQTIDGYFKPAGYVQITSLSSAVGLGTIPTDAKIAMIQCETQNVRWRDDGTNPTASVGMIMTTTGDVLIYNGDLQAIKFIEVTTSAKLNVVFYK